MTTIVPSVQRVAERALELYNVSGMAVAVRRGDAQPARLAIGTDGAGRPLAVDTLFPVASITKLATALAVLRLAEDGALSLDDPVAHTLPDAMVAQPGVTLRALLTHTSGLPFSYDKEATPWAAGLDWPAIARACLQTPPIMPPNTSVEYSNVGYGLLGLAVERVTSQPFRTALRALVLDPLGIDGFLGVEPPRTPAVIVDRQDRHRGTPLEFRNSAFFRALAEPYAGMLASLDGVLGLVRAFVGTTGFLRPETASEATRNHTGALSGGPTPLTWSPCPWGLGPELRGAKTPHWTPADASPHSFGHTGGSGCIIWTDPTRDLSWAILTTRSMDSEWFLAAFPQIGEAIFAAY